MNLELFKPTIAAKQLERGSIYEGLEDRQDMEREKMEKKEKINSISKEWFKLVENLELLKNDKELIEYLSSIDSGAETIDKGYLEFLKAHINELNEKLNSRETAIEKTRNLIKNSSIAHLNRNYLVGINGMIDRTLRIRKKNPDIGSLKKEYIDFIIATLKSLKYFDYYVENLNHDEDVFKKEIENKHGYLKDFDVFRRMDFAEAKKSQLSGDEYLRFFYLVRNCASKEGMPEAEFDEICDELGKKPKIIDAEMIKENKITERKNGNVRLRLINETAGETIY